MFTGIIEGFSSVVRIEKEGSNHHFFLTCPFQHELKVDQSVAHNGVCLTVVEITKDFYRVTAIEETLQKTSLSSILPGEKMNVERCLKIGDRLDGHWVLGHVDQTGTCVSVQENNGSWVFEFEYDATTGNFTVEKGSICVNGISLTVVNSSPGRFTVAIIPYTYQHTNLQWVKPGSLVNLEFDVLGKYLKNLTQAYKH
ncbi:MAG: riboflavin synthase [Cytophagaceae bacterium]|jgi:riboflavin synthase|nr:riboflavin synthase [Cytophagaceae bacterium]